METRANHVLIGIFTLAVLVAAFGFVWWFGGHSDTSQRMPYKVVFEGSVSGLTSGSSVLFNGIRVGEVSSLRNDPSDPRRVIAIIQVDKNAPMRKDTTARLESQGVTGVSAVTLRGGSPDSPPLLTSDANPAVIMAEPSSLANLLEGARALMARADKVISVVEKLVDANRDNVNESVANVRRFTEALAQNSDNIGQFLAATGDAARALTKVSGQLEELTQDTRQVVKAIDPNRVRSIVENTDRFSKALAESAPRVQQFVDDAGAVASNLRESSTKLDATLTGVQNVVTAIDPEQIQRSVDNVERFSDTLARNSQSVDQIVANARDLSERLNKASVRIDGILARADSLLGEGQDSGVFDQVREAAKSIKTLADNLDKRTANLSNDTGQGLRDLNSLIANGKQTLSRVDRVVRSIERNPKSFLFGGSRVPDYSPGR